MRRRGLLALAIGILAWSLGAGAQTRLPTIGILSVDSTDSSPWYQTFAGALREKGYIVDRNVRIDNRTVRSYEGLAEAAAALVRAKVDVIFAWGSTATIAAAKATKNIPIVMVAGLDPVAAGLASSMAHPGGNVTGVNTLSTDLTSKRAELLKELLPGIKRVGVLYAPESGAGASRIQEAERAIRSLNLTIEVVSVRDAGELQDAFAAMARAKIDSLIVLPSRIFSIHTKPIVVLAEQYRIPAVYSIEEFVEVGGLMSYGPDFRDAFVQAATYVVRALRGVKPGDLPIEQPTKFVLMINLKTAKALGLTTPQSFLLRADRVIE